MLSRYGVEKSQFGAVCVVVDKMEKIPREQVEQELAALGVASDAIEGSCCEFIIPFEGS